MLPHSLKPLVTVFERFIIVDMGSQDGTLRVVRDILGDRALVVQYGRDQLLEYGYAHARNYGASFATLPWVLAVDADEIMAPGSSTGGIPVDTNADALSIVTVERINLRGRGDETIETLKLSETAQSSTERHRRLQRPRANARWGGYIHETLHAEPPDLTYQYTGAADLTFYHLSEFRRDASYNDRKRDRYFWMLLRAHSNPRLQDGTNSYWYDKFVPENLDRIKAGAQAFQDATGITWESKIMDNNRESSSPVRVQARKALISALWHGIEPFSGFPEHLYETDLQGWASDHHYLADTVAELAPRITVEVGVWKGASVATMANKLKKLQIDGVVIAVDTWLGSFEHWTAQKWFESLSFEHGRPAIQKKFMANMLIGGLADHVVPLPLDSLNAAQVLRFNDIKPDLVHLDGGHDYASVMADLRAWWPLIRPGGVLIGDDYNTDGVTWPEVRQAFDDYFGHLGLTPFEIAPPKCRIRKPSGPVKPSGKFSRNQAATSANGELGADHERIHDIGCVRKIHTVPSRPWTHTDARAIWCEWNHPREGSRSLRSMVDDAVASHWPRFIRPGSTCIDIGAHSGDTAIPMGLFSFDKRSNKRGTVVAVEPNPDVSDILELNLELNFDISDFRLVKAAITRENISEIELADHGNANCNGGILEGGYSDALRARLASAAQVKYTARGITLETMFAELGAGFEPQSLSFVKIDCEGYDKEIIRSSQTILNDIRPVLFVEWFGWFAPTDDSDFFSAIDGAGYVALYPDSLEPVDSTRRAANVICIHRSSTLSAF